MHLFCYPTGQKMSQIRFRWFSAKTKLLLAHSLRVELFGAKFCDHSPICAIQDLGAKDLEVLVCDIYIYIDLKCCWIMLQREELLAIRQSSIRLEDVDCPKITCLGLARTYPLHKAAKLDRRQGKVDVLCQEFHFPKRVCLQIVGLGWVLKHITVKDIKRYRYWR